MDFVPVTKWVGLTQARLRQECLITDPEFPTKIEWEKRWAPTPLGLPSWKVPYPDPLVGPVQAQQSPDVSTLDMNRLICTVSMATIIAESD